MMTRPARPNFADTGAGELFHHTQHHPITKSCRNAIAFAALSRRDTTEDNLMPFLFWMPMIVMCGLWRAAEKDTRALFPPQQ
jgi:hypothetical protein